MDSFRPKVAESFRGLSYGLYAALVTRLALTTVYQSVRVSVLGSLQDVSQLNIASQLNWEHVLLKIVDERLNSLPIYCNT